MTMMTLQNKSSISTFLHVDVVYSNDDGGGGDGDAFLHPSNSWKYLRMKKTKCENQMLKHSKGQLYPLPLPPSQRNT